MKLETVLNAMIQANSRANGVFGTVRRRQYRKFRDWIIRRDERLKTELAIERARAGNRPQEDVRWTRSVS
jgi:hypothetical protein